MASSKSTLLSDEQRDLTSAARLDTSSEGEPMPETQYTASAPNGQGSRNPALGAYARAPGQPQISARQVDDVFREASWIVSILKQGWPYAVVVVSIIFAAGVAWQKLQTAQDKIESVAAKVQSHDQTLVEIKEGVAVVRGILEGEQRRFFTAPAVPAFPAAPLAQKHSNKKPVPRRSALCASIGVGC